MRDIKGLRIEWECGEGEVKLTAEFARQNGLFRADVIKDWIGDLETLYSEALEDFEVELKEYEPYGEGWVKEMMRFDKISLISMLREELKITRGRGNE